MDVIGAIEKKKMRKIIGIMGVLGVLGVLGILIIRKNKLTNLNCKGNVNIL